MHTVFPDKLRDIVVQGYNESSRRQLAADNNNDNMKENDLKKRHWRDSHHAILLPTINVSREHPDIIREGHAPPARLDSLASFMSAAACLSSISIYGFKDVLSQSSKTIDSARLLGQNAESEQAHHS